MKRYLTIAEVAERLGIATSTAYQLCSENVLPHVRIGRPGRSRDLIRVDPEHLDQWVERHRAGPPPEAKVPEAATA